MVKNIQKIKPNVLFIGGYGRSGSTLIELLLANVPDTVVIGEIRHLFGRVVDDRELCGCGIEVSICPFWSKILETAFPHGYDRNEIYNAFKSTNRLAAVIPILFPVFRTKKINHYIKTYVRTYTAIYSAIQRETGAKVIVDSSKYPLHGLLLGKEGRGIKSRVMLLVRDPRAVANSWENPKIRLEIKWENRMMPKHNVIRSALAWLISNRLTELIGSQRGVRLKVQRYEDFTEEPLQNIQAIASFSFGHKIKLDDKIFVVKRTQHHTIAGNPLAGIGDSRVTVREDNKWKTKMKLWKQIAVALICLPQLYKYNYRLNIRR